MGDESYGKAANTGEEEMIEDRNQKTDVRGRKTEIRNQKSEGRGWMPEVGKRIFFLSSVFCLLSSVLAGCGYTSRSTISNEFQTIYVQPFVNKIDFTIETDTASKYKLYRPNLEAEVTKAVIDKYLFDGNLKPSDKQFADLILKADLVEFRKDPLRYTENDDVEEYRINIVVDMTLWNVKENKPVWEEHRFTGDVSYFVTGPLAVSEDTAVSNAIKDLARRIVERTVEQW